jgi:hypothetical protein
MTTMLRRHDITWHAMMMTRRAWCTQSHYDIKKKNKLVSDELIEHSINNINICKKVLIQYEPLSTHIHAQRNTHMIPHHRNMRCNNMTTLQHKSPLTTLHDKCNTQTVTTSHSMLQKIYDEVNIIRSDINNLYIMTSSICNTSRQTFFSHDSARPILGTRRWAFPDIVQHTLPQVANQHRHVSQQTKTKASNKEHPWGIEPATSLWPEITDMLKHGSRFITYYALRTAYRLTSWTH